MDSNLLLCGFEGKRRGDGGELLRIQFARFDTHGIFCGHRIFEITSMFLPDAMVAPIED